MSEMQHDAFEAWIRERCEGGLHQEEIDVACSGVLDIESGEYTFHDIIVQAQWEAWQEARADLSVIKRTLSLHRSMALSGEQPSEVSEREFRTSMDL